MSFFKNFNIADWFSFYRIAAVPILLTFILIDQKDWFSWFLLISYSTDAIDGFLARKLKISSARGSQLDSYGDQLTFVMGLIGIFYFEPGFIKGNYLLLTIAFTPYLVQMVLAFKKYGKATAFHTYLAKISAIIQALFILMLLFFGPIYWLFYTMLIIGVLETIEEISLIFLFDHWVEGVKGLYWALKDKKRNTGSNK
ncbi:CDP-alcohol phosphatidyltransferase family protein [Eudoraea chungangensis]|uniref:CDP-alcohol phosphatidyltransferase family protein n=1 Tax=Eudoraea chungangensis TaxID=1481905 RepID=UPI0023EBA0AB|nr:CDP-alcohol phosphatidyltransferase family protein [Eudoraea chungangensis]